MSTIKTIRRRKDWPKWAKWYSCCVKDSAYTPLACIWMQEPAWELFDKVFQAFCLVDEVATIKRIKPGKSSLRKIIT